MSIFEIFPVTLEESEGACQDWGFTDWGIPTVVFNALAVFFLLPALFPPFLDAKRTRSTFGLNITFFRNYLISNIFFIFNAAFNILLFIGDKANAQVGLVWTILGALFFSLNIVSIYLNSYVMKIKVQNMRAAKKLGISEKEYWEKHIAPTLNL